MKQLALIPLTLLLIFSMYHFLLGLMHLESLLLTGCFLFFSLLLTIRLLTWQRNRN
ncbi:hypothetical protein [Sporolactobacillus spathodeae]|uniref:Uncharacterized protein n=1 Tax=Sporolactobacillus spathodeae TaxID=1465502 RepID=A0ABS2Q4K2_9BACL|nr:hypothetical protein [Sporolactobacillus spathodeae]MBM7656695.1 hypothetical protein [Sporolactobacillus spathodeae]